MNKMNNMIKFIGRDGKESKVLPFQYKGNFSIISIAGSGMSFDKKITQTFIETCIKSQKTNKIVKVSNKLNIKHDEIQLIMVEFFDGSRRFEIRLLDKNIITLEKHCSTIDDSMDSFYEYADRDVELIASMQKVVDIGGSIKDMECLATNS